MSRPPEPWSEAKRRLVRAKIDKEAKRAAKRLGGFSAVMVVFFEDGAFFHRMEGGAAPMPTDELYRQLLAAQAP